MKLDCVNIPIHDHDCVVELSDEFAWHGPNGKDLCYGIVYGSKWVLPLGKTSKRQIEASEFVKVLNSELREDVKFKLYALYEYYKRTQSLPESEAALTDDIERVKEMEKEKVKKPISPYDTDETSSAVKWYDGEDMDDDLI